MPWCTTPIEAESSLGPDSHHPIISLSGIPSAVIVLRILHPILASTLCAANPHAGAHGVRAPGNVRASWRACARYIAVLYESWVWRLAVC